MTSTLIVSYLGEGLLAARPATPAIDPAAIAFWYATDTLALSVYSVSGGWVAGGGYSAGTPPSVVQFKSKQGNACNSLVMTGTPANGNLLVAICFNPTSDTAQAGWTRQVDISTGTDFGVILTKICGGAESTTQSPLTGAPTVGATCIWELHHASGTPVFAGGASQAEQTSSTSVLVAVGMVPDAIGLAAVSLVTGQTITNTRNIGTQDVLDNTADRRVVAGHTDLSKTPNAGIVATFSGSGSSKAATCVISAP